MLEVIVGFAIISFELTSITSETLSTKIPIDIVPIFNIITLFLSISPVFPFPNLIFKSITGITIPLRFTTPNM